MGRKCKCKKCGKQLTTDNAYCSRRKTKSGNETKEYYCNEEEFLSVQKDKWLWKQMQLGIDYMAGYKVISNSKNKMLKELIDEGYTRKEVYDCMVEMKETIANAIRYRQDIEDEYAKLCYIFTIIKSNIRKITKRNNNDLIDKEVNGEPFVEQSMNPVKTNKRKSLSEMLKDKHKND